MPSFLRHALRSLRRTPVFTVAALLTLTLGIGSVAAMFAIVYGVLLKPLPFGDAGRLVSVGLEAAAPSPRRLLQPSGAYVVYTRLAHRVTAVGFHRTGSANLWIDASVDAPERLTATWITASVIPLLEVKPLLGRSFTSDEDRAHGPDAAVISEALWRSRFGGSRDVIGRKFFVNSVPRIVVGVMPASFQFPDASTSLWLPAKLDRSGVTAGDFSYSVVARLADGATPIEAQAELSAALARLPELFPRLETGSETSAWLAETKPRTAVVPLREAMTADIARTLWMLAAAAGLVLLVACANVANLMMIRADGRQLELSVREALGAGRLRIATHFAGEAVMLTATAAVVGLVLASFALHALVAFGPTDVPRLAELSIDAATIGFTALVALLAAGVCGVVPAFRLRRVTLAISLRDGGRGETMGRTRQRVRSTIAALQIAVALVVLAGSALLLRTLDRLRHEPLGFDPVNVATIWTQLPFARYGDSAAVRFYGRLTAEVGALPGVKAVGLTARLPLGEGETRQQAFRIDGNGRTVTLPVTVIDDGYFGATRIPMIAGHGFDRAGVQRDGDVIVSRRAATVLWQDPTGRAAIGKQIALESGPAYTVVGVVGDVRDHDLATAPAATIYMPQAVPSAPSLEPGARRTMALVVRTAGPPAAVVAAVRDVARSLDPTVPTFNVGTMNDVVRASTARLSFTLALMGAAATITLILGAIGLYGVMAYMVALRTRELGVRIALGADPLELARAVAMRGMRLIGVGVLAGLAAFAVVGPLLRSFLYGVTPADPITLVAAILVLVVTGLLASWLPARRASRIDPAESLRAD